MNRSLTSCLMIVIAGVTGASPADAADLNCGKPWKECRAIPFSTTVTAMRTRLVGGMLVRLPIKHSVSANIRAGYVEEAPGAPFRGNILYFEGLADSMRNHAPLFTRLSAEGYRVIAFDYLGQGGSEGTMNDTRIADIPKIGKLAWDRFARAPEQFSQRTIIGWSTGGLAAYTAASKGLADRVILIAPGISPKNVVLITEASLTSARYASKSVNPHLDPLSSRSPVQVLDFACDLLTTAARSRGEKLNDPTCLNPFAGTSPNPKSPAWRIPDSISGFVLLSDEKDKYVDAAKTRPIIKNQTRFELEQYAGALHEIDNEREGIRERAHADIVSFLKRTDR